ncbi:MAG TPA: hypothetical protein VGC73_12200, partial [Pyrinomonadaceae bacterium]
NTISNREKYVTSFYLISPATMSCASIYRAHEPLSIRLTLRHCCPTNFSELTPLPGFQTMKKRSTRIAN